MESLKELKEMIRQGDVLVVHEFDRFGRNKKLTLKELQYFKDNKIRLVALNLPTTQLNTDDNVILETINNIVIELYTMIAQQEIEIREKIQTEGIKVAKEKGIMELLENKTLTNIKAMEILGLRKTTYYRLLKEYKTNKNIIYEVLLMKDRFMMNLSDIQPSQLYINQEKLSNILKWIKPNDFNSYDPIPVKQLNDRIVFVDGHTIVFAI
ncbi:MAG: recombinase family protein [Romboutsia sp.]|uniref:recombinase family protein n=1 Tax=Romboutsia sp. TaxID=1965302 RepID=UPI003F32F778